jgi:hypothetical protein
MSGRSSVPVRRDRDAVAVGAHCGSGRPGAEDHRRIAGATTTGIAACQPQAEQFGRQRARVEFAAHRGAEGQGLRRQR